MARTWRETTPCFCQSLGNLYDGCVNLGIMTLLAVAWEIGKKTDGGSDIAMPFPVDKTRVADERPFENGTISVSTPKLVFGQLQHIRRRLRNTKTKWSALEGDLFADSRATKFRRHAPSLPPEDNTSEGLKALLAANRHYRKVSWPEPYNRTTHRLHLGDARDLSWVPEARFIWW